MLRLLPLVTGLLPVGAIHVSYLIAIHAERVPACIPYLAGCTSISSTGRYPPASFLFKGVMLPEAVLMMLYWLASVAWLRALQRATGHRGSDGTAIAVMGTGGAVALVLYVIFLGTHEPFYEFMRRFGIYLYFLLTIVAQLMLAGRLRRLAAARLPALLPVVRLQWWLALAPFLLGALNLVLKATLADPDPTENVIEWIVALLMQAYIAISYFAWRRTGFTAHHSVSVS